MSINLPLFLRNLKNQREKTVTEIEKLTHYLTVLYEDHPGMFPKRPGDMSIADKLRFSENLINFIEVIVEYQK